jgi:outer membrane lipoprotein carrier protein
MASASLSLRAAARALAVVLTLSGAAAVTKPVEAHAQESAADLISRIEARYKAVTTIKATVVQTRSDAFGTETIAGDLMVKRPAKLRWQLGDKLFVSNGSKMWIYTKTDNQVIEYDDIASSRQSAESLLTSMDKLQQQFDVTVVSQGSSGYQLSLKPKSADNFKRAELWLDGSLNVLVVMIVDTFDNKTNLAFSKLQFNTSMDDAQFNFTAPAGATVVKATTN